MNITRALFILRHGSYEGRTKYLEAVQTIEDELNRQKAEIERLTLLANAFASAVAQSVEREDDIRAEAVKEFAEMVKETAVTNITVGGSTYYCVGLHHLDNLVKEFTEGDDTE